MNELMTPATSSALAFVTTMHVTLLMLRKHRSASLGIFSPLLLPSVLFALSPWVLSTPLWLAGAFMVHMVWFAACEQLLPPPAVVAPAQAPVLPRAAAPAARAQPAPTPRQAASVPAAGQGARPAAPMAPRPSPAPGAVPTPAPITKQEFMPLPVLAVIDETTDIRTFRLARPEGFHFTAGQFIMVRVNVDGKPHVRCYSISSAPEMTGYMEISVKRLGLVSKTLHATVRPGSMLAVKGPAGSFTYPGSDDRPITLLAGGIGITPLLSMLRHGVCGDPTRPITLLYSVRRQIDVAFRNELIVLGQRFPHVKVGIAISDEQPTQSYFQGFIDEKLITRFVDAPEHTIFMLCGPPPMMDIMKKLLTQLGVPEDQVRSEAFQAAVALAGNATKGPAKSAAVPPLARPAVVEPELIAAPGNNGHGRGAFTLELVKTGVVASVAPEQTLLEAAELAGSDIPSLCRAGVCGTCRARVVSGEVRCDAAALDDDDRNNGFVLACAAWAKSDCVLEA